MWLFARADFEAPYLILNFAKRQTVHCSWEFGTDHVKVRGSL